MATAKQIKVGSNAKMTFGVIDNQITVYINGDSSIPGWAKVFEFDTGNLGSPNTNATVDLDDVLNQFRNRTKSVFMSVIASNIVGGGSINFAISSSAGTEKVSVNLPTFTSQQWGYELML